MNEPMNLEELQTALPIVAGLCIGKTTEAEDEAVDLVVEAARLVANPNLNALIEHLKYLRGVELTIGAANELWHAVITPPGATDES